MKESNFQFTNPSLSYLKFEENKDFVREQNEKIEIGTEIKMLIDEAYVKAQNILLEHREKLDQLSTILMEKEDHMKTQSYWDPFCSESEGMRSRDYIDYQTDGLIMFGNVNYLLRKECEDIREKFGD